MSIGNLIGIRRIVRDLYPKCLPSAVVDEHTGVVHDPEKLGEAIIRHAEIMHDETERLYDDAARVVLAEIKEQAALMGISHDPSIGPVLQHDKSDATYESVAEWIESLEHRLIRQSQS